MKMTKEQEFRKQTEEAKFEAFALMCKKVADLEKENKILTQNLEDTEIINKTLGERCNQLLADKGKLTDELDKWKSEWNEQVIKANEEGFARTKQTIQLSKAKELIEDMCDKIPASHSDYYKDVMERARQFLSEVDKCLKKKN